MGRRLEAFPNLDISRLHLDSTGQYLSFSNGTEFHTQTWNMHTLQLAPLRPSTTGPCPALLPFTPLWGSPGQRLWCLHMAGKALAARCAKDRCSLATRYLGNSELRWGQTAGLMKPTAHETTSAKAGRHSVEGRGFMPTEAPSAQRLLGEEGKKREEEREEERGGGLLFQSRHPPRVKNQV